MQAVPFPCRGNNIIERGVSWVPAKDGTGFFGGSDKTGGITGAAGNCARRDGMTGDGAGGIDDLFYGEADTVTKVENIGCTTGSEVLSGEDMRLRKVGDVDVVSDTGAIRRRVVIAIYLDALALSQRDL